MAAAFSTFVSAGTASADQLEFIELLIEHLTEKGMMDPRALYTSPFTDVAPSGPEQVFSIQRTDELIDVIDRINLSADEQVA